MLREAFKDLLKSWGKQHDLIFVPEYKLDTLTRDKRYADGALLYELRVPFGYWGPRTARVISMKRSPKSSRAAMLKADKDAGAITLDSQTTL